MTLSRSTEYAKPAILLFPPSASPSGDRLVSNSQIAGNDSILVMNRDGSKRSVLFEDSKNRPLAPVWSPTGDKIAFGLGQFRPH